ncbi:MAG: hypothetical protein HUU08_02630 [Candidatus Brocadia sp.]|nr:hypothetical protein [Candidatus Brocadia sp.]
MPVEEKVDRLERALEEFVTNVGIEFNKLYNSQMRTEAELRDFKNEMRQQTREMNIKWGEMARKMGTITEDLVSPSIPGIIREEFGIEVEFLGIRMKKRLQDGRVKEYDAVAVAGEFVFVDDTKSTLDSDDVKDFIKAIQGFRDFFPEYKGKKIVGILASLFVDESVIRYAEKSGFFVLAVGDKLMEVKNTKGFKPKEW